MKFNIMPEEELIHEALNGSRAHLNVLISMYEPFIMETVSRHIKNYQDLLDVRQRICCKITDQFIRKTYTHQDKFPNWANTIIQSEINSYFRKKKRNPIQYFSSDLVDAQSEKQLMVAEDVLTMTPNILFYIDQLAAEQAVVIKLKHYQNKTFREISKMVNVPINTVMGRYRYGIERIRELVKSRSGGWG